MALDGRLLDAFAAGRFARSFGPQCALLRVYGWQPHAITVGYSQDTAVFDLQRCRDEGVDLVRRPTGGRAVLHADEFTYSFLCESEASSPVLYRLVHAIIREALAEFGVVAHFSRRDAGGGAVSGRGASVSCFAASARHELQVDGRKLVGSAQRRHGRVLLQHGSLPLSGRHRDLGRYLVGAGGAGEESMLAGELQRRAASLEEVTGSVPGHAALAAAFRRAAGVVCGASVPEIGLGELERLCCSG